MGLGDKDCKNLLEVIPNKITDTLGIVADVNFSYEGKRQYIEIIVDKYPSLISCHGKYFYRSGSTMRTIIRKELDKAILKSFIKIRRNGIRVLISRLDILATSIQISVYEDKIYIWNDGEMPFGLDSAEKLFEKHSSKLYNPKLANVFFKSGMIEAWGRGFEKLKKLVKSTMDACRNIISAHLGLWFCVRRVINIWSC